MGGDIPVKRFLKFFFDFELYFHNQIITNLKNYLKNKLKIGYKKDKNRSSCLIYQLIVH